MALLRELDYGEVVERLRALGFRFFARGKGSPELWAHHYRPSRTCSHEPFAIGRLTFHVLGCHPAIRNGVRQSSVVSGPVLLSSDNSQFAIRNSECGHV